MFVFFLYYKTILSLFRYNVHIVRRNYIFILAKKSCKSCYELTADLLYQGDSKLTEYQNRFMKFKYTIDKIIFRMTNIYSLTAEKLCKLFYLFFKIMMTISSLNPEGHRDQTTI